MSLSQCPKCACHSVSWDSRCRAYLCLATGCTWSSAVERTSPDRTTEALIAALRARLKPLRPGDRLDVFDAILAGYCVQCGDEVEDVCHCNGEEYHERDDPAYDKNNPGY